jgi:hypothetical protein
MIRPARKPGTGRQGAGSEPEEAAAGHGHGRGPDRRRLQLAARRIDCQWRSAAKLVLNRQGVGQWSPIAQKNEQTSDVLRVGFLGRCDLVKGVQVLVDAFLPADMPIELDICVVGTENETEKYRDVILRSAASDRRIRVCPTIPHSEVGDFLAALTR